MSCGDVMMYMVKLDTWKQRFDAILEFNKLEARKGYKFMIKDGFCYLDPPTPIQSITRWYNGYSKEQFRDFLEDEKPKFFDFLEEIRGSNILQSRTVHTRSFTMDLFSFLTELAKCFSLCRTVYPGYYQLSETLLSYYHDIRKWITNNGY